MSVEPAALPPTIHARCPVCKALLFKARLPPGSRVEIICQHCRGRNKKPVVIERPAA